MFFNFREKNISAGAKINKDPLVMVPESQKAYFSVKENWAFCDLCSRYWSEDCKINNYTNQ